MLVKLDVAIQCQLVNFFSQPAIYRVRIGPSPGSASAPLPSSSSVNMDVFEVVSLLGTVQLLQQGRIVRFASRE